jgi:hypothetical protein
MREELKACWSCGKPGIYTDSEGDASIYGIQTHWCSCSDPACMRSGICFTVDQWQSRPIEDKLEAENAALKEAQRWHLASETPEKTGEIDRLVFGFAEFDNEVHREYVTTGQYYDDFGWDVFDETGNFTVTHWKEIVPPEVPHA